ncbi:MAG: hypothetical protein Q8L74_01815, partial [Nitrospirota bacterium]|nr:hypothetical protein [Nitrospirota bacterium]
MTAELDGQEGRLVLAMNHHGWVRLRYSGNQFLPADELIATMTKHGHSERVGRGDQPRPYAPAYLPAESFFSSFLSSLNTTWP